MVPRLQGGTVQHRSRMTRLGRGPGPPPTCARRKRPSTRPSQAPGPRRGRGGLAGARGQGAAESQDFQVFVNRADPRLSQACPSCHSGFFRLCLRGPVGASARTIQWSSAAARRGFLFRELSPPPPPLPPGLPLAGSVGWGLHGHRLVAVRAVETSGFLAGWGQLGAGAAGGGPAGWGGSSRALQAPPCAHCRPGQNSGV